MKQKTKKFILTSSDFKRDTVLKIMKEVLKAIKENKNIEVYYMNKSNSQEYYEVLK